MRIVSLFSGAGAFEEAFKQMNIPTNVCVACDIDKYAKESYLTNFEADLFSDDVTTLDVTGLKDIDFVVGGSPCFQKGSLVMTDKGYIPIEDIKIGDMVLTHKGRFRKVLAVGNNKNKDIYQVKAQGSFNIFTTDNHPFLTREVAKKYVDRKSIRILKNEIWKETKELKKGDFLATVIYGKENNDYDLSDTECWLLGRYVADGHIRNDKRKGRKDSYYYGLVLSIGKDKLDFYKENTTEIHSCIYKHTQSTYRAVVNSKRMVEFIKNHNFGMRAIDKQIPLCILNLPKYKLSKFIDGYLSGDGCLDKRTGNYKASSISKKLIMGLQLAIGKVYNASSTVVHSIPPKQKKILGRLVNQNEIYTISFSKTVKKQSNSIVDDYIYNPFKETIKTNKKETVYNLEVEQDNTYTVNNVVVHNCQSFSMAGNRVGLKDTRGLLIFEYMRIVDECKPRYFIYENVPAITSDKKQWQYIYNEFEKLGYSMYIHVLNAKDYGIPQSRKRLFIVGFRDNQEFLNYSTPGTIELGLTVQDLLESSTEAKYYLSEKMKACVLSPGTKGFINKDVRTDLPIARTLLATMGKMHRASIDNYITDDKGIRRLTPRECFRLMGFSDDYKIVVSDTQAYKQAGNSIVVDVIKAMLKEIFKNKL